MTLLLKNTDFVHPTNTTHNLASSHVIQPAALPDYIVACFVMAHVLVWGVVGVFDR